MTEIKKDTYVRVRDGQGNEFVCPIESLKDVREATDEELDNCVDDGTAGRYAGNINVVDTDDAGRKK